MRRTAGCLDRWLRRWRGVNDAAFVTALCLFLMVHDPSYSKAWAMLGVAWGVTASCRWLDTCMGLDSRGEEW